MSYKKSCRTQANLLPSSIEEYVSIDDPVRLYDNLIEVIDLKELGIDLSSEHKVGNSRYDPRVMFKILVYSYSYGWRSSRKIERALHHNLSFIWLSSGLKPDHKTISEFRRKNIESFKLLLKQIAHICIKLNFIEGNDLFLDGSKIRGNCSINASKTEKNCKDLLSKLDKRIEEILLECETADRKESGNLVLLRKELQNKQSLKNKITKIQSTMVKVGIKKVNTTDKDSINFKSRQGYHAGYNAQTVVDRKHGLIVNSDVVNESNDFNQFTNQIEQANEILGKQCETATADAGYSNTSDLKLTHDKGIKVIVPSRRQSIHIPTIKPSFSKDKFLYDETNNHYICPKGKVLKYLCDDKGGKQFVYGFLKSDCHKCVHFGECTTSKKDGRRIKRLQYESVAEELEIQYLEKSSQEMYKLRKSKVEAQFGHIKRNLNGGYFLLRGLKNVKGEMGILSSCYNITRMTTLSGGIINTINKLNMMISEPS
jgi:transposase